MKFLKGNWKWIVPVIAILILIYCFFDYAKRHGAEHLFNMQEVNGKTDNNPYGIRNELYSYLIQDMKKSGIKELQEPKVKMLLLNFAKLNSVAVKVFSDRDKSREIALQQSTLAHCLWDTKGKKINVYMSSLISDDQGNLSGFEDLLDKTPDLRLIQRIISSHANGLSLNSDARSPQIHPELCDKYDSHILEDNEFWTKDSRIKGK